jgi:hypothetical protein
MKNVFLLILIIPVFIFSSCVKDLGNGYQYIKSVYIYAQVDTVMGDTVNINVSMSVRRSMLNHLIVLDDNKDTVFKKYFADTTEKELEFRYIKEPEEYDFYLYLISTPTNSEVKTEYYEYFGLF